jgi:hypothetical protein
MKSPLKSAVATAMELYERISGTRFRYIFILGHMRSGSTLLNHILMSHPDILGSGERNARYETPADLATLRVRTYWLRRSPPSRHHYVVDQINHNGLLANPGLLRDPCVYPIFLVREPVGAITSMLNVLARHYGTTLDDAVDHYVGRVSGLARCARALPGPENAAFLTYEDLVYDTRRTLGGLTRHLSLGTRLSEQYQTFEFTGTRGDPGPKIGLGTVSRDRTWDPVEIPPDRLATLAEAYADCLEALEETGVRASAIGGPDTAPAEAGTSRDRNGPSTPPAASA